MPTPEPTSILIPDFFAYCDFPLHVNPHEKACTAATNEWIGSALSLTPEQLKAAAGIKVGLMAAIAWPNASMNDLRVCADINSWLFHIDDLVDDLDVKNSVEVARIVLDVLRSPDRYAETVGKNSAPVLVDLVYNWWTRLTLRASPRVQQRFIDTLDLFFQGVKKQSELRTSGNISDFESYMVLRRDEAGVNNSFVLTQYAAGLDLPDEVLEHPHMKRLQQAANDWISLTNDVFSFKKEHAAGQRNNIVTILMEERGISMQLAFDGVGDLCKDALEQFIEDRSNLPSWGPEIDRDVAVYVQGLADWVVGCLHWSYSSERYFGDRREEVKRTRRVEL